VAAPSRKEGFGRRTLLQTIKSRRLRAVDA